MPNVDVYDAYHALLAAAKAKAAQRLRESIAGDVAAKPDDELICDTESITRSYRRAVNSANKVLDYVTRF